jgi:hypothetical protein
MGIYDPPYRVFDSAAVVIAESDAMPSDLLTVSQAAARKGVPDYVIRNAIRGGTLAADNDSGVWLIRVVDLDAWEGRTKGRPRQKKRGRPPKQK